MHTAAHRRCSTRLAALCGVVLSALILSSCGGGSDDMSSPPSASASASSAPSVAEAVQQALQAGTAVNPEIVTADNEFGLGLLAALNPAATQNVAISPLSVALALQMVFNGAAGSTEQGMSQALQLQGLSALQVDQQNAALQAALMNPDPEVTLSIANSLWMHLSDNSVLPSFTTANQTYYAAQIGDLAGAPDNVNAWVSNATDGLITQILPPANYAAVVAVLANTVYFKGAWSNPFAVSQTSSAPFNLADGTQVSCQMMHQTGAYPYLQGQGFQALLLPYGQNARLGMLIVLPASGVDFNGFVTGISAAQLAQWSAQLQTQTGSIALPRFTSSFGSSLVAALSSLGMGVAFDANSADFSALAPNTYLSDVEHKTVLEVDEGGTVATAATTVTVSPTVVVASTFSMSMDRPFFYAIVDNETGQLLFIGTLVNPSL